MDCAADASVVLEWLAAEESPAVIAERLYYHSAVINQAGEGMRPWRPSAFGS